MTVLADLALTALEIMLVAVALRSVALMLHAIQLATVVAAFILGMV